MAQKLIPLNQIEPITKSDVGLSNVDNTSDLNKPISTATQTALNLKADTTALTSGLAAKQDTSAKDTINGYAGLDGTGKINPSQLPAIAVTDTFLVASQAAQVALTAEIGDVAVRTDINKSYILRVSPASTFTNWQEFLTPTDLVASIFGRSGTVTAQSGDYNTLQVTENTNLYFTTARVLATVLSGFAVAGTRTAILATDSVLLALGKIQKYLDDLSLIAFSGSAANLTGTTAQFNSALTDNDFATLDGTETLSNKTLTNSTNIIRRVSTVASSATPTPTGDSNFNHFTVTALAVNATLAIPSGTPADGNTLVIRIKDNATARTLAFNAIYRAVGVVLPTTTVINKTLYLGAMYNSADSKWDINSYVIEA